MSTFEACSRDGALLLGKTIQSVRYVGLYYDGAEVDWDFGEWHWPEVGVELTTTSGETFYAIWDTQVTQFELTFARGSIKEQWLPLRDDPEHARSWDVSEHPLWRPLLAGAVERFGVAVGEREAPLGVRIQVAHEAVWLIAAQPNDRPPPRALGPDDVWIGSDEVLVGFGDALATRLGLAPRTPA